MSRSKELCKGIRKKVLGAYESGKGLKKILYKNGCPSKFSPRVKCLMEKEVSKNPLDFIPGPTGNSCYCSSQSTCADLQMRCARKRLGCLKVTLGQNQDSYAWLFGLLCSRLVTQMSICQVTNAVTITNVMWWACHLWTFVCSVMIWGRCGLGSLWVPVMSSYYLCCVRHYEFIK